MIDSRGAMPSGIDSWRARSFFSVTESVMFLSPNRRFAWPDSASMIDIRALKPAGRGNSLRPLELMYSPQEFKTSQVVRPKERLRGVQGSSGYARSFVEQQDGEGRRAVLIERVLHRGRNEDFRKSEPTRSYFWGIRAR